MKFKVILLCSWYSEHIVSTPFSKFAPYPHKQLFSVVSDIHFLTWETRNHFDMSLNSIVLTMTRFLNVPIIVDSLSVSGIYAFLYVMSECVPYLMTILSYLGYSDTFLSVLCPASPWLVSPVKSRNLSEMCIFFSPLNRTQSRRESNSINMS